MSWNSPGTELFLACQKGKLIQHRNLEINWHSHSGLATDLRVKIWKTANYIAHVVQQLLIWGINVTWLFKARRRTDNNVLSWLLLTAVENCIVNRKKFKEKHQKWLRGICLQEIDVYMLGLGESCQAKKRQKVLSRDLCGVIESIIQSINTERRKRRFMITGKILTVSHNRPKTSSGCLATCYQQKAVFNIQRYIRKSPCIYMCDPKQRSQGRQLFFLALKATSQIQTG